MVLNWLSIALLLSLVHSISTLQDGGSATGQIDSSAGGSLLFAFSLTEVKSGWDLAFSQTSFSDYADPVLYLSLDSMPDEHHYQHHIVGSNTLTVSRAEILTPGTYYLNVNCPTYCRVLVTARYRLPVELQDGEAIRDSVLAHEVKRFTFQPRSGAISAKITVIPAENVSGRVEMTVTSEDWKRLEISEDWLHGMVCLILQPAGVYSISLYALSSIDFLILGESEGTVTDLITGKTTPGTAHTGSWSYYKFHIPDPAATVYVSLTVLSGAQKLYIRPGALPSAEVYTLMLEQEGAVTLTAELSDLDRVC